MPRRAPFLLRLALLLGGVAAGAVLLAPPLYQVLLGWGWIEADEFLKVLRRLLLIPLLLGLFLWLRPWRDGGPRSYGLWGPRARPALGLVAYAVTAGLLLVVLAWQFRAGWLAWEDPFDPARAYGRLGRWLAVGLGLAVLEEWFFRGWLDRRLGRVMAGPLAVVVGCLLYAAIHAFKPSRLDVEVTPTVAGAVTGLLWWLEHLVDPVEFGPKLLGLFLFGLVLLGAWRRTGTLWTSIGIHAAGVTVLRSYGAFTVRAPERTWAGGKEILDGPVGWTLLAVAALLLWRPGPRGSGATPGGRHVGPPSPESEERIHP